MKKVFKIILFVLVAIVLVCTVVLIIDNKEAVAPTQELNTTTSVSR